MTIDWKAFFNCVNTVAIVGITLGVAGVVVGVLGWMDSRRGLRLTAEAREREKSAEQSAKEARLELLIQRAAEDFRTIGENVEQLSAAITSKDWKRLKAILHPLKRQLSEANGSFRKVLKGIEMDKLEVAISAVRTLVKWEQEIPTDPAEEAAFVQVMIDRCDRISDLVDDINGRLKYLQVEELLQ